MTSITFMSEEDGFKKPINLYPNDQVFDGFDKPKTYLATEQKKGSSIFCWVIMAPPPPVETDVM